MSDKGEDWVVDGSEIDPEELKRNAARLGNIAHRYPINHELWDKMEDISIEGAALYSFGIDPDAILLEMERPDDNELDLLPSDYRERLSIIKSAVRAGTIERVKVNGRDAGGWDDHTRILKASFKKWCKAKPGCCNPAEVKPAYPKYQPAIKPPPTITKKADDLSTRERNTLLKIIIGMAVCGYRYDPNDKKPSEITGEKAGSIHADLGKLGISVDVDTIRKYLKEAKELLPPQKI
ncbi:MAG: hypothetical protein U0997_07170 [Sulfurimicrobium sp.]|nr:hypothetical protein [Sulfurimicrobium sp.]